MKKLIAILLFPFMMYGQEPTKTEIVNPVGKWYFGAEIGQNTITSYTLGEPNKSFQGGILAEYYFGRHWSLTGRVKYFETGLSLFDKGYSSNLVSSGMGPNLTGLFDRDAKLSIFEGKVITMPINIKWEFRIYKNFAGNLNFGINYNIETESKSFYTDERDYERYNSKQYYSYNSGFGFNYFINNKSAVFLNIESYIGGQRGKTQSFIFSSPINNSNTLLNFGFKYNFKKLK